MRAYGSKKLGIGLHGQTELSFLNELAQVDESVAHTTE
jgi:hypothetical protein